MVRPDQPQRKDSYTAQRESAEPIPVPVNIAAAAVVVAGRVGWVVIAREERFMFVGWWSWDAVVVVFQLSSLDVGVEMGEADMVLETCCRDAGSGSWDRAVCDWWSGVGYREIGV